MINPPKPDNEKDRLANLKDLRILDTPIEERFERITRIVCRSLGVPISAISLVDEERQWFKSIRGLDVSQTPRNIAFCAHAILQDTPLVVPDAHKDPRFEKNPLVTDDPNIRFYAGCPLTLGDGFRIGTLCAIDRQPRDITEDDLGTLKDLAAMVESELSAVALSEAQRILVQELEEAERAALIDPLCRIWNRAGGEKLLEREWEAARRKAGPLSIAMLDIDHFKAVNDQYGHAVGDQVIRHFAHMVLATLRPYDVVSRWGGEEFLLIFPECAKCNLSDALERVLNNIRTTPVETSAGDLSVTASIGACTVQPIVAHEAASHLQLADQALYEAKKKGRDRFVVAPDPAPKYLAVN